MNRPENGRGDALRRLELLSLPAAVVVAFFPVLVVPYLFSDEFSMLLWIRRGDSFDFALGFGRPGSVWVSKFLLGFVDGAADAWMVRLVYLVVLGLLAAQLAAFLRRTGAGPLRSGAVAVLATTTVPASVWACWAAAPFALAGLFGATAALVLLAREDRLGERPSVPRLLAALGFLFAGLATYQPAAMFFWVVVAIDLLFAERGLERCLRRLLGPLALFAGTLAVYYPFFVFSRNRWADAGLVPGGRGTLASDPVAKIRWFVAEPLREALGLGALDPYRAAALAVGAAILVGLLLRFDGTAKERFGRLALALGLVPLTYLPNLVIEESWSSFRTQAPLHGLVVVAAVAAADGWWRLGPVVSRLPTALPVAAALLSMAASMVRAEVWFARPQEAEHRLLRLGLERQPGFPVERVLVVLARQRDSLAPSVAYDELGSTTTSRDWAVDDLLDLELPSIFPPGALPAKSTAVGLPAAIPPGTLVVDMRMLANIRRHRPSADAGGAGP